MFKKLQILILLLFAFSLQAAAQYTHVEFSYQSFRPFLHFQLDFDSHGYHNSYETAYLKGYMDGVNDSYYYNHRFADLVRDRRIYEAGYRDGLRDHRLMIRLRGRAWYNKYRFHYDDYYSPTYSVRVWLDGLSLAFLQAPAHRLPKHWKYRAHPHFIKYRKWYSNKHHYKKKYGGHYRFDDVERRFQKRIRDHRKKAVQYKKRHRKDASYARSHRSDVRFRNNRAGGSGKKGVFKRSNERKRKSIQTRSKERRKAFKSNRGNERRKSVGKSDKRKRSRGAVIKKRGDKKEKSKRSRSRTRGKRGDGN